MVQRLTVDLKTQAHFVGYGPPAFIAFHDGAFLAELIEKHSCCEHVVILALAGTATQIGIWQQIDCLLNLYLESFTT